MVDLSTRTADLKRAHLLMSEALSILDAHDHLVAAHLDFAIVRLGLRQKGEGLPPGVLPADLQE